MKITYDYMGSEEFVELEKWENYGKVRYYIRDSRGKQRGYYDPAQDKFFWNSDNFLGKKERETAIREKVRWN